MTPPRPRRVEEIPPLDLGPDIPPPRPGSLLARRILALLLMSAMAVGGFLAIKHRAPSLLPGRTSEEEEKSPISADSAEISSPFPVPPSEETPEETPKLPVTEQPAGQIEIPAWKIPTETQAPNPRPAPRPATTPTKPSPSSSGKTSSPSSAGPAPYTPPRRRQPTPAPTIPTPTPSQSTPTPYLGKTDGEYWVGELGASQLGKARPINLPSDALRSRFRGTQITARVEVDERGKPLVVRLSYPPSMERKLRMLMGMQAEQIIKEIAFRPAQNSLGETVRDEITVKIPLR